MKIGKFDLTNYTSISGIFITTYHLGLLVGLPLYFYYASPSWPMVAVSIVLLFVTELGITAAYHRYYSHRAYNLSRPVQFLLLALGTIALQGSVIQWSHDHRKHHAFVDGDEDPYSIKKGFWYAHILWLYEKPKPIDEKWVSDLMQDRWLLLQHKYYGFFGFGSNVLVFLLVGWMLGDFLGAFVLAWWTRLLLSHHLTWFINSLAHFWGSKTFSKEHSAVDNFVIAFLTVGEGYHNYHHTFASDYRNGVRWYHFDPAKWMVWSLSKLGLAKNLKRYDAYTIKKRLLAEERRMLLDAAKRMAATKKAELEQKTLQLSDAIREKLNRVQALAEEIRTLKKSRAGRDRVRAALAEFKRLRQSLREDWRTWTQLCGMFAEPGAVGA